MRSLVRPPSTRFTGECGKSEIRHAPAARTAPVPLAGAPRKS
jgi:hypothetical protein